MPVRPQPCVDCGGSSGCACHLTEGDNVTITGTGSASDPFIIGAAGAGAQTDGPQVYSSASNAAGLTTLGSGNIDLDAANLAYLFDGAAAYTYDAVSGEVTIVNAGIYSLNFGGQTKAGGSYVPIQARTTVADLTDGPSIVLLPPFVSGQPAFAVSGCVVRFAAGDVLSFRASEAGASDLSYFTFRLMKI